MKLKCNFEIIELGEELTFVPVGYDDFCGVLRINRTSADILELLKEDTTEDEVVAKLQEIYDVSEEDARRSIRNIVDKIREVGLIEE